MEREIFLYPMFVMMTLFMLVVLARMTYDFVRDIKRNRKE
jgi:hypothetical protein